MTARCRAERCGRPLKTEESRARGYGPVCWRRAHPTAPTIPGPVHATDPRQIPLPLEDHVDEQPEGIDAYSTALPTPEGAARRVNDFLSWFGDGLVVAETGQPPLFARDLQVLANLVTRVGEK